MSELFNYCHVAERTDVGCVRAANEDSMINFTCVNGLVAAVCDGMGGHVGGAVASQTAVAAIKSFLEAQFFSNPFDAIVAAIDNANQAILNTAAARPELAGMGATCVMVIVRDGMVYYGCVGDSRIYLVRNHVIKQLTRDQSYVQTLVDAGEITPEQAEHHPQKNVITNALGLADMRPATVAAAPIAPEAGDCFLLCSDGLSGMVPDAQIGKIVSKQQTMRTQARVDALVELARQNGGKDNITAQIVEFSVTPKHSRPVAGAPMPTPVPFWKNKMMMGGIAAVAVALLASSTLFITNKCTSTEEIVAPTDSTATDTTKQAVVIETFENKVVHHLPEVPFKVDGTIINVYFSSEGLTIKTADNRRVLVKPTKEIYGTALGTDVIIEPEGLVKYSLDDAKTKAVILFRKSVGDANEVKITFKNDNGELQVIIPIVIQKATPKKEEKTNVEAPKDKEDGKKIESAQKIENKPLTEDKKNDSVPPAPSPEEKPDTAHHNVTKHDA